MRMLIYRCTCLTFMILIGALTTTGQQPPLKRFMTPDGMPHQQARMLEADEYGFVWIATMGGIGLYDGQEVRHIQNCPELNQENIYWAGINGSDIWALTEERLFRCTGEELIGYHFSSGWHIGTVEFIEFSPEGFPEIIYGSYGYIKVSHTQLSEETQPSDGTLFPEQARGTIPISVHQTGEIIDSAFSITYLYPDQEKIWDLQDFEYTYSGNGPHLIRSEDTGKVAWKKGEYLNLLDGNREIVAVFVTTEDSLRLVASRHPETGAVMAIDPAAPPLLRQLPFTPGKPGILIQSEDSYIPPLHTASLATFDLINLSDRSILSSDEGIYVYFRNGLSSLNMDRCAYAWSVFSVGDHLCVSCYQNGIFEVTREGEGRKRSDIPTVVINQLNNSPKIHSNYETNGKSVLVGSFRGFLVVDTNGVASQVLLRKPVESFAWDPNRELFFAGGDALYSWDQDSSALTRLPETEQAIRSIFPVHDLMVQGDALWAAGQNGLLRYSLRDSTVEQVWRIREGLPCKSSITLLPLGESFVVGSSCGLLQYQPEEGTFSQVLPDILDTRINQLALSSDSLLIAVASDEISVIDISRELWELVYRLDQNSGVEAHEPSENGIYIDEDRWVFIPHSQGIQVLDLDFIRTFEPSLPTTRGIPYILVSTNDQEIFYSGEEVVRLEGNSASFTPLIRKEFGKTWSYRFVKNKHTPSAWTTNGALFIDNLSHGNNTLTFEATSDNNQVVSTTIHVSAYQPFWQRKIVRQTLLGTIVILLLFFFYLRIWQKRREARFNYDLAVNKLRTIQTFFNPHFLLNALTSLQYAILYKSKEESNALLISLSRTFQTLIYEDRGTKAPLKFITLSQEIQLIRDIASLFDAQHGSGAITLDISIDQSIDPDTTEVPQLLIEPFVENAYKHAFRQTKTSRPTISVCISRDKQDILVTIHDNGQGFDLPSGAHLKSHSMSLAHERIRLLNAIRRPCALDIRSEAGKGTRVEIRMKVNSEK